MTLILKHDLHMVMMYLYAENEVPSYSISKVIAWTVRYIDRDTHRLDWNNYLFAYVNGNYSKQHLQFSLICNASIVFYFCKICFSVALARDDRRSITAWQFMSTYGKLYIVNFTSHSWGNHWYSQLSFIQSQFNNGWFNGFVKAIKIPNFLFHLFTVTVIYYSNCCCYGLITY